MAQPRRQHTLSELMQNPPPPARQTLAEMHALTASLCTAALGTETLRRILEAAIAATRSATHGRKRRD